MKFAFLLSLLLSGSAFAAKKGDTREIVQHRSHIESFIPTEITECKFSTNSGYEGASFNVIGKQTKLSYLVTVRQTYKGMVAGWVSTKETLNKGSVKRIVSTEVKSDGLHGTGNSGDYFQVCEQKRRVELLKIKN